MQFTFTALLAVMATVACSQSIPEELAKLPACSVTCLQDGSKAANCGATDYACQCGPGKDAITKSAIPCIAKACQPSDIAVIQSTVDEICKIQAASPAMASSDASSAATSATSAAASEMSSAMTSASAAVSSAASAASSAVSSVSSKIASAASSASSAAAGGASPTSSAPAQSTTNAASKLGSAGAVMGAALIAAFAL